MADPQDYDDAKVGYGRPPKASRFKPGQSGNPKGRAKGVKNASTIFREEAQASIPVVVDGRKRNVAVLRLALRQLLRKAASGHVGAMRLALIENARVEGLTAANSPVDALTAEEERGLDDLLDLLRRAPGERET